MRGAASVAGRPGGIAGPVAAAQAKATAARGQPRPLGGVLSADRKPVCHARWNAATWIVA